VPISAGVKVTVTLQVWFLVSVRPVQFSVTIVNSLAFVPVLVTPLIVTLLLPLALRVTVCGALVVPSPWYPK
jgi:hypothetical protein